MSRNSRYWVIIPAAGAGQRMGGSLPKQYLDLHGRTVLEWALHPFLMSEIIAGIVVVVAAGDSHWPTLPAARHHLIQTVVGGSERVDSVRAGVAALVSRAHEDDWVLVHDAARPCLRSDELALLIEELGEDAVGGLLAVPLADTLKQSDNEQRVVATIPRAQLWRAMTPQMFRFALLLRALDDAIQNTMAVTDDSAAVEALGLRPRLVQGSAENIKITVAGDLQIAAQILSARE